MINLQNSWSSKKIPIENILTGIIVFFLAIHMFCFPFVVYPTLQDTGPSWLGLDVSCQMTMNYAKMQHLVWGKDIIFSYGPLSFLSTRIGFGVSRWVFLLFDLFVVVNFFFVFKDIVAKSRDKFLAILILLGATLMINSFYGTDTSWALMFFTIYWMYRSLRQPAWWCFALIAILITLSFYIKANTGLVILLFFAGHLVNLFIFKKISLQKAAVVVLITALPLVLLGLLFHVSFFPYIKGSLEIIRGYNDVMYLEEDHHQMEINLRVLFTLTMLLYIFALGWRLKEKKYEEIFFILAGMAYLFLIKKQSVVRNDTQHLREFFSYGPLILLCGNLFSPSGRLQKFTVPAVTIIILLAFSWTERPLDTALQNRFANKGNYYRHFKYYKPGFYLSQQDKRFIPVSSLQKIGQHSIDVFPWDGEYLLENHLHYTPRPTLQSFLAYTSYLEKQNYNFYLNKGPDFVLYDYDAIDNRYPFHDETLVNLFLAKNYTVADTFTSNERWRILLQRKPLVTPVVWEKEKEQLMDIQQEIPVEGAACMKISVHHNWRGKFRSFRYKAPPIQILLIGQDGQSQSFRTSVELLNTGIMVERKVLNTADFVKYVSQKDSLPPVVKLRLQVDPRYFQSKIKVEYFRLHS